MKNIEKINAINDIEEEDNKDVAIKVPFNPNDIKVSIRPYTLGQILDDLDDDIIKLNTDFQRLAGLWSIKKKSRFIESLLLNLPIPSFYFAEDKDKKWEIVDGLQRISSLKEYVKAESFNLESLEFLDEYTGWSFKKLPKDLQRRIKTFQITIYVIEKGTPSVVKYNIFSRINQGGLVLKPQEIRHALHQGIAADLVQEMVSKESSCGKAFLKVTESKIKSDRMEDRDFATRFAAFYLIPYKMYEPDLDSFMNKGMGEMGKLNLQGQTKLKADFEKAMKTAYIIFEDDAFRKRFEYRESRKPINKALFEVLSVNFAKLEEEELALLIARKVIFKEKLMLLHNDSNGKFLRSISHGTAQKEMVEQRFKDIEKIIKETLTS